MTELTLALNFIIIFLLVTAIIYGFVLNKRIKLIRESGKELTNLFRSFDDTILKAQNSVGDLKKISAAVSEGLQKKIDKSVLLMDDLEFLGERAAKEADKASKVLANLKKMENSFPDAAKSSGRNVVRMPLITEEPRPTKTALPTKESLQSLKKKALSDLLEEASRDEDIKIKTPVGVNNNLKPELNKPLQRSLDSKSLEKKQFSIASALKALGYGD